VGAMDVDQEPSDLGRLLNLEEEIKQLKEDLVSRSRLHGRVKDKSLIEPRLPANYTDGSPEQNESVAQLEAMVAKHLMSHTTLPVMASTVHDQVMLVSGMMWVRARAQHSPD